ncbi:hypothetical protein LTR53_011125 [Teratosphaeriaceae sp. CCFEE 6253]|nr:hypothetical protein LTR53_011125 [Teratosphaeriaceae sp. CCFEE 6253]
MESPSTQYALPKTSIDDHSVASSSRAINIMTSGMAAGPTVTSTSTGSDSNSFTDYGLKRALERTVSRPHAASTKQDQKDDEYVRRIREHRRGLFSRLRKAEQAFTVVDEQRDANQDPCQAPWIHAAWLKASAELTRAERDFNIYVEEIQALQGMEPKTRAELQREVTSKRARGQGDLKGADEIDDALRSTDQANIGLAKAKQEKREAERRARDLKAELLQSGRDFQGLEGAMDALRKKHISVIQEKYKLLEEVAWLQEQLARLGSAWPGDEAAVRAVPRGAEGVSRPCVWHPAGACQISSPEEQERGKFCKVLL